MPAPTLKQIAEIVGCSKNTVSLSLRNSNRISESVRKRIREVAEDLSYTPNPRVNEAMRYVRAHKKRPIKETLGILVDWPASKKSDLSYHQHLQVMFNSFEKRAHELGYSTDYFFLDSPGMTEARIEKILKSRGIRGIAVMPMADGPARLSMDFTSFASIQIGRTLWYPRLDTVAANDANSVYLATKILWRKGYRNIGFFFSRWALAQSLNRLEMGSLYSQQHVPGIGRIPIGISEKQKNQKDVLDSEKLRDEFIPWFKEHRPDAIICLGVPIKAILEKDLGLSVPKDVGIVQYDYVPKPGIDEFAGISLQKDLQAAYAVERLSTKISHGMLGLSTSPIEVSFPVRWVEGPTINKKKYGSSKIFVKGSSESE